MNFTTNRKQFLSALKTSAQAVQAKNLLPIMDCLKLDLTANSSTLTITGGNEEMYITNICQIIEPSDGKYSLCIIAKDLVDAISSIDDETVTISADEYTGVVEVQYKRGKLSYPFFSSDEYSVMPVDESDSKVSISEEVLYHLIGKTIKFVSTNDLRPVLMGINFSIGEEGDGKVVCVGADMSKMCKVLVSDIDTSGCTDRKSFILPGKACQLVSKSIPTNPSDKMVDISFSEKNITFVVGGVSIFTRCIEGRYASYNAIIPNNTTTHIELCKTDVLSAIDRVGKSLSKGYDVIQMRLMLSGIISEIEITAEDLITNSSGKEYMDCTILDGSLREDMIIGLKKEHAGVVLANSSTPNVRLSFTSPMNQILIEGYDGDEGVTMVLMPYFTC